MAVSAETVMAIKTYQNQAEALVKNYFLADPFIPYTSVLGGIFACKVVYDLTQLVSTFYIKAYNAMSLYFVFWSDLFSDQQHTGLVTLRSSQLSIVGLGVSIGYFFVDFGMIFLYYPTLGGKEYVIHHSLSTIAVAYSMLSGELQLYTYMCLISEVTTPEINMRWYLDTAGLKRSAAYLINGYPDEPLWLSSDVFGSGSTIYDELDVVWEDHKGIEESLSKETVTHIGIYQTCSSSPGRSNVPPPPPPPPPLFTVYDRG
uniref:TLC domain-containing protein n=1 Tax=Salix viminalis TaxID=40686 RepID=A0A6N2MLY5_SALVM